jgi:lipid II:glycine glycyltransferase (peptidoglycan interpeptide bridge formation enzyme)
MPGVNSTYLVKTDVATDVWDPFVASHPYGHLLQTSRWGELKARFGWQVTRVALHDAHTIVAGAQVLLRRTPWGQNFAYVPRGPVVDWSQPDLVAALLPAITRAARRRRAYLLRLEPELADDPAWAQCLAGHGLSPSPETVQPRSTVHIDLTVERDEILGRMKQKWRYNVRLAARKGVQVRHGTHADLPAIQTLLQLTGERDGFGIHSADYYRAAFDLFVPAGLATWLLAEHEGELLAAIAVFALGTRAWYLWGASGNSQRNLMPNHAVQWAAIDWAKAQGCTTYDLWGIPDEVGARTSQGPLAADADDDAGQDQGLWGVWRFKQGFGGQVVRYVGAWDQVLSRPGHWLHRLGRRYQRQGG